jgi:hypothetical protein
MSRRRSISPLALVAGLLCASGGAALELEGASLEVDLTTAPEAATAALVIELPDGLERLELTWLELGGAAVELGEAWLLGPGSAAAPASPSALARDGSRPAFDLTVPLGAGTADALQLSYRTSVPSEGPVTVPIPAPHRLLAAGSDFGIEVRVPPDRGIASPFPAGLREVARDPSGALYRAELPVVPSMLRFRLVPEGRWWSVPLLVDLAIAGILLTLLAVGWRRFARMG